MCISGATYYNNRLITGMEIYQKSMGTIQSTREDLTKPLKIVLTYVVIVYVMELIAYGKYNAVTTMTIKNMIIIYIITFILSGAVNAYYCGQGRWYKCNKNYSACIFIEIFLVVLD